MKLAACCYFIITKNDATLAVRKGNIKFRDYAQAHKKMPRKTL
jgi:hypothetical protein